MKRRQAKKIHKKWLFYRGNPKWKRRTLETALDLWLYKRFRPDGVSDGAW